MLLQVVDDGAFVYVVGDPGLPSHLLANPYANLPPLAALDAQSLAESKKAIGRAQLSANVLARDVPLRFTDPERQREAMSAAAAGAPRAIRETVAYARNTIGPLLDALIAGQRPLREVQEESARLWRQVYEAMRVIGRNASGLTRLGASPTFFREEETWFRAAVREELTYWNTMLRDIDRGQVAPDRARKRFDDYIRATRFMFEAARVQAAPDNVLLYWAGPRDSHRCAGCEYLQSLSPFPKSHAPATPRDGQTSCGTRCRHRIVVRVVQDYNDVIRRRNALPSRADMIRELRRLKEGRMRRRTLARPSGVASNPFRGSPIVAGPRPRPFTYRGRTVRTRRANESIDPEPDPRDGGDLADPQVIQAVKRAGFDDVAAARLAVQTVLLRGKVKKLSPRTVKRLVALRRDDGRRVLADSAPRFSATERRLLNALADLTEPRGSLYPAAADLEDIAAIARMTLKQALRAYISASLRTPYGTFLGPSGAHNGKDFIEGWASPAARRLWVGWWQHGKEPPTSESVTEAIGSYYSTPYASMRLVDVARLFRAVARKRPINGALLSDLVDRIVSTVEYAALPTTGTADASRISDEIRDGIAALADVIDPAVLESIARLGGNHG